MKKLLLVAAIAVGLVGMAMVAGAATNISNWCTGTYQLAGSNTQASGEDSAVVARQTAPTIAVTKLAKNLRTGQEADYSITGVAGDSIQFTLIWSNTGEATADTVVIRDYVPGNFTSVSETSDTISAGVASGGGSFVGNVYTATYSVVQGTDGTAGNGLVKFVGLLN